MLIIGCDYHPGFQQIAMWIRKLENCKNDDSDTQKKRRSSTVTYGNER